MENQAYSRGRSFWLTYLEGRPQIPDSFFDRLYHFHEANGGKFDDINDVGAGLGNLSVRLAEKFCRVVVTEPSELTLKDAELFIRETAGDASQFSFIHAAAEDDVLAPASVDAIFICNALHWIDCDRALPVLAKQLNSGGTLFAALFGIPVLTSPEAQTVWQRLFDIAVPLVVRSLGEDIWRTVAQKHDSGYDDIAIPGEYFEPGVIRLRLNASEDMHEFCSSPAASSLVEPINRIQEDDEVRHVKDESLFFEASLDNLKDIYNAFSQEPDQEETQRLWEDMECALGKRRIIISYPVSIIMATRR